MSDHQAFLDQLAEAVKRRDKAMEWSLQFGSQMWEPA